MLAPKNSLTQERSDQETTMNQFTHALLATLCAAISFPALTQTAAYPSKPVRIIVPLGAGGAPDVIARAIGNILTEKNGQPYVIENKPGANTRIGTEACARAVPDGSTLCVVTGSSVSINPLVYRKLSYDPSKDFETVATMAMPDMVLVASPKLPVANLAELVAYSQKNPNKVSYSSFGIGSDTHVTMEWVKRQTKADFLHVPFNGFGPMFQAFNTGDIQLMYLSAGNPGVIPQIQSGKMKALAVFAPSRSPQLPDVPTVAEAGGALGLGHFLGYTWFGILAPAGTPKAVVAQLNSQINAAIQTPALREQLATMAMRTRPLSTEAFADFLHKDRDVWRDMLKETQISLD